MALEVERVGRVRVDSGEVRGSFDEFLAVVVSPRGRVGACLQTTRTGDALEMLRAASRITAESLLDSGASRPAVSAALSAQVFFGFMDATGIDFASLSLEELGAAIGRELGPTPEAASAFRSALEAAIASGLRPRDAAEPPSGPCWE